MVLGSGIDSMKIELTQGKIAIVDSEDYGWLNQWNWTAAKKKTGLGWYVYRQNLVTGDIFRPLTMARQILGLEYRDSRQADHINHDNLDNRRENIRILTAAANKQNQPSRGGSSRFVGVTWDRRGYWRAQIQVDGKMFNLGGYDSEEEAALARDAYVLAKGTHHALNLAKREVVIQEIPTARADRVFREQPRRSLEERFWEKVDIRGLDECWLWVGRGPSWQHARIRLGGKEGPNEGVHRVAWILTYGQIPEGLWVLHRCDTPRCVNPKHLFLGTVFDNNQDRHAKGRYSVPRDGKGKFVGLLSGY